MMIKKGVILSGLDLRMRPALLAADEVWKTAGQELTITCCLDGTHSAGSMHYYGLAIDCRTHYFDKTERKHVFTAIKHAVGAGFDVILHKTHIHIEARL